MTKARELFDAQRNKHLASLEDKLYKRLFASEGEEGYEEGDYKPYSFTQWLEKARGLNRGNDILGDYNFSPEELHLRKSDNPFVRGSGRSRQANEMLRLLGHSALAGGYSEAAANNRQFPDEYKRYMNPYEDEVVKKVIEDMRGEKQEGLDSIGSQFTKAGAHGSKILKPNAENKYDRAMEKMIMGEAAKLRSTGYQQAAQIFNADRLAREQNIASRMQVPFGMQKFERGQLGTLENLNNAQMYDRQSALNAAHGRFREQHDQPFNDISNLHSIFSQGGGYRPSGSYEQPAQQYPSFFGQESKEGGRISLSEAIHQIRNREPHFGKGGVINKLFSGKNPFKGFTNIKRALPDIIGLGTATFGGVGGGALGGAARAAMLKRNLLEGALKGGLAGYAIPAAAGMAGNALGRESGIGRVLSNYGASNAGNFGSIGTKYLGMEDSPNIINKTLGINPHGQKIASSGGNPFSVLSDKGGEEESFFSKLMGKDKGYLDYATSLAPVAMSGLAMKQARGDVKRDRADSLAREEREREMLLRQVAYEEAKEAKQEEKSNALLTLNAPVEDERRAYEIAKMKFEQERMRKKDALEAKMEAEKRKREEEEEQKALEAKQFLEGLKNQRYKAPILAFDDGGRVACFKEGGRVARNSRALRFASGGYVDGNNSGVKDNVAADLPEGAYVLDATTISLLGDGNSKSGAKKIDDFLNNKRMENRATTDVFIPSIQENRLKKNLRVGGELAKVQGRIVPAKISNGEYVLTPEDVLLFSKGSSLAEGAKALDKFRERLKAQKGVKRGGILPVTKSIEMYLS